MASCETCGASIHEMRPQVICQLCEHRFCASCQSWALGGPEVCERCEVQPSTTCNCQTCNERRHTEQMKNSVDRWLR